MKAEMVLNELSLVSAENDYTARQWMSGLVQTIIAAVASGAERSLRLQDENFYSIEVAPEYTVGSWCRDSQADREERRYLMSLATKAPLIKDLPPTLLENIGLSEAFCEGDSAGGLGVAFLLESLALSLPSSERWSQSKIVLRFVTLHEEESESEVEEVVRHASRAEHVEEHKEWFQELQRQTVEDGEALWEQREEIFPSLVFCIETEEQIRRLGAGHPMFHALRKKLFELEDYCQGWTEGSFNKDELHNASPESEATMKQYAQERTFQTATGEEYTFSWHLRMSPGAWRLYFAPSVGPGRMLIGYVGPHLRTKKFS
jgi:hypothetical protein